MLLVIALVSLIVLVVSRLIHSRESRGTTTRARGAALMHCRCEKEICVYVYIGVQRNSSTCASCFTSGIIRARMLRQVFTREIKVINAALLASDSIGFYYAGDGFDHFSVV